MSPSRKRVKTNDTTASVSDTVPPKSLEDVQLRIKQLIDRIPSYEDTLALSVDNVEALESWCESVRAVIRHYELVLHYVKVCTYEWKPSRQGHTRESLNAVLGELSTSNGVTSLLSSNVSSILTPNKMHQTKKIIKTTDGNVETKEYVYETVTSDPELLALNRIHLCNEGVYKRDLLLNRMQLMEKCIGDYLHAENGRGDNLHMSY